MGRVDIHDGRMARRLRFPDLDGDIRIEVENGETCVTVSDGIRVEQE